MVVVVLLSEEVEGGEWRRGWWLYIMEEAVVGEEQD